MPWQRRSERRCRCSGWVRCRAAYSGRVDPPESSRGLAAGFCLRRECIGAGGRVQPRAVKDIRELGADLQRGPLLDAENTPQARGFLRMPLLPVIVIVGV